MSLKLYLDFMSQPSRALYIFLKVAKIPFEKVEVALRKGEHFSDSFKQINRFQKVPCIVDNNNFYLSESVAILRYLKRDKPFEDFWYPSEKFAQAKVDEYLEWQHNNTRTACAMYFQFMWLLPLLNGKPTDTVLVKMAFSRMVKCLDEIENIWLKDNKFLAGDRISIADIFGLCEIEQTRMAGYNPLEGRPKMAKWFDAVKAETNPYYDEAHQIINKIIQKQELKNKL